MPRYFFDTYDGERFQIDDQGTDLNSIDAAKAEGQVTLSEMAKDCLPNDDQRVFAISIRDETGHVAMRIALTLVVEYSPDSPG